MSRWLWPWSNCVKERVCRYLLHHYLGHFFQEHLSLDQLSLDLYKGSVALRDIHLEIWVRRQARVREGAGAQRSEAPGERVRPGEQAPAWTGRGSLALSRRRRDPAHRLQSQNLRGMGFLPPLHWSRNRLEGEMSLVWRMPE